MSLRVTIIRADVVMDPGAALSCRLPDMLTEKRTKEPACCLILVVLSLLHMLFI